MGFKEVILATFGYLYEYKNTLTKALLIPFVFYMLLDATELMEPNKITSIIFSILAVAIQTIFAITTHRIILLGANSIPEWGLFSWTKRETFFALHLIGLILILIPMFLLAFIPVIGWIISLSLTCWVFGRLSLVFPAIAIDQGVSFKLSWQLTKNRQLLMFLVVIVFPAILLIPAILINILPYTFVITSFLSTLATVFMVAALSVTYKLIYKEQFES